MVYGSNGSAIKKMGLSADDIMTQVTLIKDIMFKQIETKRFGIQDGRHGNKFSEIEVSVSTTAHNRIQELMRSSKNIEEYTIKLRDWAEKHLEVTLADGSIGKGSEALPGFLKKDEEIPKRKCRK